MKFEGQQMPPGEFASRALIREIVSPEKGWTLSPAFYFSQKEVESFYFRSAWEVKWPVEIFDDSLLYVPHTSELLP